MKRYPFAAVAAGLFILLASTSSASTSSASTSSASTSSASTSSTPAPAASIVITGFAYSGDLTVRAGQVVTVTNADPADPLPVLHTVTDKQTALFDTGPIQPGGGTATFTAPTKPGSYPFGCIFHLLMQGTLVVQD